jgi:hypothetical protein
MLRAAIAELEVLARAGDPQMVATRMKSFSGPGLRRLGNGSAA